MKKIKYNKATTVNLVEQFATNGEPTSGMDNSADTNNKSTTETIKPIPAEDTHIPHEIQESLMPELEELVKKNPNRLIGCGG